MDQSSGFEPGDHLSFYDQVEGEDRAPKENTDESFTMSSTEDSLSARPKSKRGRKTKQSTSLFLHFRRCSPKISAVKKENTRVQIIRGYKRAIREIEMNLVPRKKIHGFNPHDYVRVQCWTSLSEFVRAHPQLYLLALTVKGPNTDGKRIRTSASSYNSHSDDFCKELFSSEEVRTGLELYLSVVFGDMSDANLCARFKIEPVAEDRKERQKAWRKLWEYFRAGMYDELEIKRSDPGG